MHKYHRCFLLTGVTLLTLCDWIVALVGVSEDGILRKKYLEIIKLKLRESGENSLRISYALQKKKKSERLYQER